MNIKVVLADDHAIVRHGLSRAFQQEKGLEVVGQAQDGLSLVKLVEELSPDVVVMDISMPDLNGIEATRRITAAHPKIKVIGLSMHSSDKYVREMFKAGACGYLLKDCPFDELVEAIRIVVNGKKYISPSIGDTIIKDYLTKPDQESAFSILSAREREVLQLLVEGHTTKQVGQRLGISPKTVEVHRTNIMEKLKMDNIAQLTKYAIQEGLTAPEP
ncbi:MAG TPA: response regulator transcription factor [Anaerohalosphaeraceae bacterium]|nr:MAG: Transcriptional regulatory protein DegU [Planctomycetes bacterium ADurb.Bin412]HPY77685.1 response regulator transcription factor [Anaerohalosphaeraceae bacterium]